MLQKCYLILVKAFSKGIFSNQLLEKTLKLIFSNIIILFGVTVEGFLTSKHFIQYCPYLQPGVLNDVNKSYRHMLQTFFR